MARAGKEANRSVFTRGREGEKTSEMESVCVCVCVCACVRERVLTHILYPLLII